MRNLEMNKRPFVALNYLGKVDVVDKDGYKTGEQTITYSDEIKIMGHISGAKGSASVEMFGMDIQYDKTIILTLQEVVALGLDENTVFFIDKRPEYDAEGMPLYDYKVVKKSPTLNEVAFAISKVRR